MLLDERFFGNWENEVIIISFGEQQVKARLAITGEEYTVRQGFYTIVFRDIVAVLIRTGSWGCFDDKYFDLVPQDFPNVIQRFVYKFDLDENVVSLTYPDGKPYTRLTKIKS